MGDVIVAYGPDAPSEGERIVNRLGGDFAGSVRRYSAVVPQRAGKPLESPKLFLVVVSSERGEAEAGIFEAILLDAKEKGATVIPVLVRRGSISLGMQGVASPVSAPEEYWDAAMDVLVKRAKEIVTPPSSSGGLRIVNSILSVVLLLWAAGWASVTTGIVAAPNAWAGVGGVALLTQLSALLFPEADWAKWFRGLMKAKLTLPALLVLLIAFVTLVLSTPILELENTSKGEVKLSVLKAPPDGTVGTVLPGREPHVAATSRIPVAFYGVGSSVKVQIAAPDAPVQCAEPRFYSGLPALLPTGTERLANYRYSGPDDSRRIFFLVDEDTRSRLTLAGRKGSLRLFAVSRNGTDLGEIVKVDTYRGEPIAIATPLAPGTNIVFNLSSGDLPPSCGASVSQVIPETLGKACDLPDIAQLYYAEVGKPRKVAQHPAPKVFCGSLD